MLQTKEMTKTPQRHDSRMTNRHPIEGLSLELYSHQKSRVLPIPTRP